jgi:GTPase
MRAIVIDIVPKGVPAEELDHRLDELDSLVRTYSGVVVVEYVQKRDTADYRTFVGSGKLDEMLSSAAELKADVLIIGNILKPAQLYNISEEIRKRKLDMQAWDRVDLILKIFADHAKTPESKLQIELASIRHMGPRIFGMGMELSRQGGGIGTVGIGETNTERMRRHLREREQGIRRELEKYVRTRSLQRDRRRREQFATFGIVGYTNAGKSSLMNALTKK